MSGPSPARLRFPPAVAALHASRRWCSVLGERGAAAVEFALVAPIVILLLLSVIEVGRVVYTIQSVQHAVQETARHAMVHTETSVADLAEHLQLRLPPAPADTVAISLVHEFEADTRYLTIVAELQFALVAGIVPLPKMTLSGRARIPR